MVREHSSRLHVLITLFSLILFFGGIWIIQFHGDFFSGIVITFSGIIIFNHENQKLINYYSQRLTHKWDSGSKCRICSSDIQVKKCRGCGGYYCFKHLGKSEHRCPGYRISDGLAV